MRSMAVINNRMGVGTGGRFFLVGFAKMEAIEISEVAYLEIEVLEKGAPASDCRQLRHLSPTKTLVKTLVRQT